MSSHREAPGISQDPAADSADVYAFVSPDDPTTVTIISNYVPLQAPPGGPNFFEFGDDVLYSLFIDNDGDALPEITYQFRFNTTYQNPDTFLYNTGPIGSLTDPNWNKRQHYSVSVIHSRSNGWEQDHSQDGRGRVLGSNLACPPCNIGPRSTPNYTRPRRGGGPLAARRHLGVRGPAERRLLRRPRRDLRPRRHQGAQQPAPDPDADREERRSAEDHEHPHDRDQGPDQDADQGRLGPDRPVEGRLGPRHLGRSEPSQGRTSRIGTGGRSRAPGRRSRVSATRSSTRSSSRSGTRTVGTRSTRSTTRASRST